uniref:Uncharacterized protein n=1 Tax=Cacopsylla melanoneura TaxID=428564 RepID=A0A8D8U1M6_9HEMI
MNVMSLSFSLFLSPSIFLSFSLSISLSLLHFILILSYPNIPFTHNCSHLSQHFHRLLHRSLITCWTLVRMHRAGLLESIVDISQHFQHLSFQPNISTGTYSITPSSPGDKNKCTLYSWSRCTHNICSHLE